MFEKFTDRARKLMALANQEAQRFNHEYVGTEHILLGMVKEGSGVAATIMKNLNVDLRKVRLEVEKLVKSGPDMVTLGKLPQTPCAKKVIEFAIEESRSLGHNYVGTEHLLLGLLREKDGIGAQVLMNLGLKLEDIRKQVLDMVGDRSTPEENTATALLKEEECDVYTFTNRGQTYRLKSVSDDTVDSAFSIAEASIRKLIGKMTVVATTTELADLSVILVKLSEMQNKYKK